MFIRAGIDTRVTEVDFQRLSEDQSFTSIVQRTRLSYDRNTPKAGPSSIIIKSALPGAKRSTFLPLCYAREISFYRELANRLNIGLPRVYYAEIDPHTSHFILVLEDFPYYVAGDNRKGATRCQAIALLDEMARYHAQWWNSDELKQFSFLGTFEMWCDLFESMVLKNIGAFIERHWDFIEAAERKVFEALPLGFRRAVAPLANAPATLVHHDLSLKNTLIEDIPGHPKFVVIDWQQVSIAPAVRDMSFFIGTSLMPALRYEMEFELLHSYHSRLQEFGVRGYSFSRLIDDYRRSVICDYARIIASDISATRASISLVRQRIRRCTGSAQELRLMELLE